MTGELLFKLKKHIVHFASDTGSTTDRHDRYPPTDAIGICVTLIRRLLFLVVDGASSMRSGHIYFLGENAKATLIDGRQVVGPCALYCLGYRNGKPTYRMATGDEVELDAEAQIW